MYFVAEEGMKLDKSSPECKEYLLRTLDALEKTLEKMKSTSSQLARHQAVTLRTAGRRAPASTGVIKRGISNTLRSSERRTRSAAIEHARAKLTALPHRRRESWAHRQVRLYGGDASLEAHHGASGRPKAHDFKTVTEGKWAVYSATHGSVKAHARGRDGKLARPDVHSHMDVTDRHPLARGRKKSYMGCGPVHHRLGKC